MARQQSESPSVPAQPISIPAGLLHLLEATARTAARDAAEVGEELLSLARRTGRGVQSGSVAIARDLAEVARHAAEGARQGIGEIGEELARLRVTIRPRSSARRSRRSPARRRTRGRKRAST
jgi:hypothetical protein